MYVCVVAEKLQKHHKVIGMEVILNLLKFNILSLQRRKLISNTEKCLTQSPPAGEWQSWDEELKEQSDGEWSLGPVCREKAC